MNKQIKALKMAIEVLSQDEGWFDPSKALKACKEALAEAEKQEWQSLSDDEVREIRVKYAGLPWNEGFWRFYNDVEQALKEKNYEQR